MYSERSRRSNPLGCLVIGAVVIAFVALFAVVASGGDDDSPPRCPVSRSGAVDMVPGGPRPCVLYGAGHGVATGTGTHHQGGGQSAATSKPGGSTNGKTPTGKQPGAKVPAAPKAPAAPAPKAPAAPAVRAPSIGKR